MAFAVGAIIVAAGAIASAGVDQREGERSFERGPRAFTWQDLDSLLIEVIRGTATDNPLRLPFPAVIRPGQRWSGALTPCLAARAGDAYHDRRDQECRPDPEGRDGR